MVKVIHFNNLQIYQRREKGSIKAAFLVQRESEPWVRAKKEEGYRWRQGGRRGRSGN